MALIKIVLAFCLVAVAFAVKVEDKGVEGDLKTDSSVGFGYSYGNIHPYGGIHGGIGISKYHGYPHGYGSYYPGYPGYSGYGYYNGYYPGFSGYPYGHGNYYGY